MIGAIKLVHLMSETTKFYINRCRDLSQTGYSDLVRLPLQKPVTTSQDGAKQGVVQTALSSGSINKL